MSTTPDAPDPTHLDTSTDADADALALAQAQAILAGEGRVRDRLSPNSRLLYGVWGVAWLAGYLLLWVTATAAPTGTDATGRPADWAFGVFGGLIATAVVVTIIHVVLRSRGLRGVSATTGTMYGWSWMVAFTAMGVILGGLSSAGLGHDEMALVSNALPSLIVGVLYMAGAATYREWPWFVLGAWIALVGAVATLAGMPTGYLVMAVAGGGGMLVGALAAILARARDRTRGRSRTPARSRR